MKITFFGERVNGTQARAREGDSALKFVQRATRQAVAAGLMLAVVPMSVGDAFAQGAPPPPPDQQYGGQYDQQYGPPPQGQAYQPLPPETLDQLVAPIALYPDSLVAQVLAGSTYPAQVSSADQFVHQYQGAPPEQIADMANQQPWDPSIKALTAFPQVLDNLTQNLQWTTQLGNAYYNQPQDVMNAVQEMRQRAYQAGTLRSTQQLAVEYEPGAIVIQPVSPEVVYVPYYDPWVVYGAPLPAYGYYHYYGPPRGVALGVGLAIGFGVGIAVGAFTHFGWGYHHWDPDWHSRTVVYNHTTYISNSVTVVNHGNYGAFDRNPQARAFNHVQAVNYANVNHTTINNVTVNRTNNNFNRTNVNNGTVNNNRNFNNIPGGGTPAGGNFGGARPGQFNNGQINGGVRPGQQPGQFNAGRPAQPVQPAQPGQFNSNGGRFGQANQPGQFNGNAGRPVQPNQPAQFNNGRPFTPAYGGNGAYRQGQLPPQGAQFNGGGRPAAAPQFNRPEPQVSRPAPQARPQASRPAPKEESHGHEGGGGEHHH